MPSFASGQQPPVNSRRCTRWVNSHHPSIPASVDPRLPCVGWPLSINAGRLPRLILRSQSPLADSHSSHSQFQKTRKTSRVVERRRCQLQENIAAEHRDCGSKGNRFQKEQRDDQIELAHRHGGARGPWAPNGDEFASSRPKPAGAHPKPSSRIRPATRRREAASTQPQQRTMSTFCCCASAMTPRCKTCCLSPDGAAGASPTRQHRDRLLNHQSQGAQQAAAQLQQISVDYLDAPVTGGTEGAQAGTSRSWSAGCHRAAKVRPVLEVIGSSIHHFGPAGRGHKPKQ